MAEYFPGYGETCPRPCVYSSRSSMAGYFTGTDTSIHSSILVILWTACVERPRKFPRTFHRKDPSIYVLCCLISNFEAFRLLNLEVFEALLLIKKLLIKKLGVMII